MTSSQPILDSFIPTTQFPDLLQCRVTSLTVWCVYQTASWQWRITFSLERSVRGLNYIIVSCMKNVSSQEFLLRNPAYPLHVGLYTKIHFRATIAKYTAESLARIAIEELTFPTTPTFGALLGAMRQCIPFYQSPYSNIQDGSADWVVHVIKCFIMFQFLPNFNVERTIADVVVNWTHFAGQWPPLGGTVYLPGPPPDYR
ncbi:hypothetical protein D9613_000828 [Agrocybe pediades]|uniref:Uncharacterized protein n=1 Tax=Agrocybe pediades TaxID=84607 RepID=A0A8H4VVB5_9AGAR|nr:hypothetical protein D9613_000828 [Agrocybe pediades]